MKTFWSLFAMTAVCLLLLIVDGLIADYEAECPKVENSAVYDKNEVMICKDGRHV